MRPRKFRFSTAKKSMYEDVSTCTSHRSRGIVYEGAGGPVPDFCCDPSCGACSSLYTCDMPSRDVEQPIRAQYSHHVTKYNLSEHSTHTTCRNTTNQSTVLTPRDEIQPIRAQYSHHVSLISQLKDWSVMWNLGKISPQIFLYPPLFTIYDTVRSYLDLSVLQQIG